MAKASSKDLAAIMELKRLCELFLFTSCQLFTVMVAPIVDYASDIWMCEFNYKARKTDQQNPENRSINDIGTFVIVAVSVAKAEVYIAAVQDGC